MNAQQKINEYNQDKQRRHLTKTNVVKLQETEVYAVTSRWLGKQQHPNGNGLTAS